MKSKIISLVMSSLVLGSFLLAPAAYAVGPTYVVTCSFSDGSHWWGSTPDPVKATMMVSRCEGDHGGTASFDVGIK